MHDTDVGADTEAMDADSHELAVNLGAASTNSRQDQKSRVRPQFTLVRDQLFQILPYMQGPGQWHIERSGKTCFSQWHCTVYSYLKVVIVGTLGWKESVSPVTNIVTKVRISIGDEAVNVLCFPRYYYRSR